MLLLDPADVPLHVGKMLKYLQAYGHDSKFMEITSDGCFNTFAVLFFINRVCMYPYICWSATFESSEVWSGETKTNHAHDLAEWTAISLLLILQVLQIWWFSIIAKMAYKLLVEGGEVRDNRSDDEE